MFNIHHSLSSHSACRFTIIVRICKHVIYDEHDLKAISIDLADALQQ